jgi:hypothetical protein
VVAHDGILRGGVCSNWHFGAGHDGLSQRPIGSSKQDKPCCKRSNDLYGSRAECHHSLLFADETADLRLTASMVAHIALKSGSVMVRPAAPAVARKSYFRWGPIDRNASLRCPARAAMIADDVDNGIMARTGTMDRVDDDGMDGVHEML